MYIRSPSRSEEFPGTTASDQNRLIYRTSPTECFALRRDQRPHAIVLTSGRYCTVLYRFRDVLRTTSIAVLTMQRRLTKPETGVQDMAASKVTHETPACPPDSKSLIEVFARILLSAGLLAFKAVWFLAEFKKLSVVLGQTLDRLHLKDVKIALSHRSC